MPDLPEIGGLWVGGSLTFIERLSIQSYLDRGHPYTLYTLEEVDCVPDQAAVKPAADILSPPFDISDRDRLRTVCYSNLFRMEMFQKTDAIWADLDTYCVRSLKDEPPLVVGRTHNSDIPNHVNTSTLRLPPTSPTLKALQDFYAMENPEPLWKGERFRKKIAQFRKKGRSWQIQDLPWGGSGHRALTHFLSATGEITHAQPVEAFHSLHSHNYASLFAPAAVAPQIESDGVKVLHFFGQLKKILTESLQGIPPKGTYLEHLCERHHVTPTPL